MIETSFKKLYWGFIFIMLGVKIQGFDILPDIVGYILFAYAFKDLGSKSNFFTSASKYNIPMIILSIFSIYQRPNTEPGIHFGTLGIWGISISIASFILNLLVMYNLFMGIKDIADKHSQYELGYESSKKWNQYLMYEFAIIAGFILIFIPLLGIFYTIALLIGSIFFLLSILSFLKRCIRGI